MSASWTFACAFTLASLVTWLAPALGDAQEAAELTLDWRADSGCPDRAWAETKLRDRLGGSLTFDAATASALRVSARLARTSSGYTLSMTTVRGASTAAEAEEQGTRTLSDARCEEIAQAAILVIALAVEDQKDEPAPAPPEAAPPVSSPASSPSVDASTPVEARPPSAPRESRPASSLALRLSVLIDAGFLPRTGVGPEVALAFVRPRGRVELSGFWLPWRATEPDPDGRVTVMLWALRPTGCLALWPSNRGVLQGDLCLGLELGQARARGSDLNPKRQPNWAFRSAWASLRFGVILSPQWLLMLSPGLAIPLGRPSYVSETTGIGASPTGGLGGRTELHTPNPVSARLSLGIETRF